MQYVSGQYEEKSKASMRPLSWHLLASFKKEYNASIKFFTIGTSLIGGSDIIRGTNSVIQEWDKYIYEDFSDRVLSIEYTRESDPPVNAVTMAMADITLDNHDDIFTSTNRNGRYFGHLGRGRPVRLYLGFEGVEDLQVFVGLTDSMPEINEKDKTAKFHCVDFLKRLANTKLTEETIYIDSHTDTVISGLLQQAGLSTDQFELDQGTTLIPFAYFKKDSNVLDALRKITEAELGSLYMDEQGVIRLDNRSNWATKRQSWSLDKSNVLEISAPSDDKIINSVEITAKRRKVLESQPVFEATNNMKFSDDTEVIAPGESKDVFVNFRDDDGDLPVTSVDTPIIINSATSSYFDANTASDGSGSRVGLTVTATYLFSTAYKITFNNPTVSTAYLTKLLLYGMPAKVVEPVYVYQRDEDSIDDHEEQTHKIENEYFQDIGAATSAAGFILNDRAQATDQRTMLVKGFPQLQVGDFIGYSDEKTDATFYINRINGILNKSGFRQTLNVSERGLQSYFTIGISEIGSEAVIAP